MHNRYSYKIGSPNKKTGFSYVCLTERGARFCWPWRLLACLRNMVIYACINWCAIFVTSARWLFVLIRNARRSEVEYHAETPELMALFFSTRVACYNDIFECYLAFDEIKAARNYGCTQVKP